MMTIAIGADHGGVTLKNRIIEHLQTLAVKIEDLGGNDAGVSVDYGDFAQAVAECVMEGQADRGILICKSGIGMSMAANRYPGIRAALCANPHTVIAARDHNNANILVLAGNESIVPEALGAMLDAWCRTPFSHGERHIRRLHKLEHSPSHAPEIGHIARWDSEVYAAVKAQALHEHDTLNLIASENTVSRAVRETQGCVMTNKYAEGYPGKRWYNGCRFVDQVEQLGIERAKALFGADHVNLQPHCGSAANMAVYFAALQPGDTILAMALDQGGHLTHGSPVNFSGKLFNIVSYGVSRETETIDYDSLEALARNSRPKLIVAGASAYPRALNFARFREIADRVGALLMVDMAHIAGLVAGGAHANPVPHADFVTTTTHKTLRGPRSGMVLCTEEHAKAIDKTVFPGLQGGPQMHTIAAKAVCFHEALQPAFKTYAGQIVRNAKALADALKKLGFRLVSGGTDNHLLLVDLTDRAITGKAAANALDAAGVICNKNAIPFDSRSPFLTSGIRLGTAAVTTRGLCEPEMRAIASWIDKALKDVDDTKALARIREQVTQCAHRFPLP